MRNKSKFGTDSEWLDEADVKIRFADKPAQGESILKTAEQFWHEDRGVILYEVKRVISSRVDEQENEQKRVREHQQDSGWKADSNPKKKTKKAAGDDQSNADKEKPLTEPQRKRVISFLKNQMAKHQKAATTTKETYDSLSEPSKALVPAPVAYVKLH